MKLEIQQTQITPNGVWLRGTAIDGDAGSRSVELDLQVNGVLTIQFGSTTKTAIHLESVPALGELASALEKLKREGPC